MENMMQHHKAFALIFITIFQFFYVTSEEPRCSKYDFEEKVLEKLIRLEHQFEILKQDFTKSLSEMKETKTDMEQYIISIDETLATVKETADITSVELTFNKTLTAQIEELNTLKGKLYHPATMFKARTLAKNNYVPGETFIFTNVFSEHGDGYNPITGVFTVPVSGMYWFQVTLCLRTSGCVFGIIVDGENILLETVYESGGDPCFSYSTVHLLSAGQSVVAKALSGYSKCNINQDDLYRWNTFYGLLLQG